VQVDYEGTSHSLEFDPMLSYSDFGGTGAGPALITRAGSTSAQPAILRYGNLWRRPLPVFAERN
jgi:hypothetical protein